MTRRRSWVAAALIAASLGAGASSCAVPTFFSCTTNNECGGGTCIAGGCAFPSGDCDSGLRYGALSPPRLAGLCVGEGELAEDSGTSMDSTSATATDTDSMSSTVGDGDPGDGDPTAGDGDPGDGDPTAGDGDPGWTTGDGDGDPGTGDGDGDPLPELPCDPRFDILDPNPAVEGQPMTARFKDVTGHVYIGMSVSGSGFPMAGNEMIGSDGPSGPYHWTYTITGHAAGMITLTFTVDMGTPLATCQVHVVAP